MSERLAQLLKVTLADTFTLYLKTHNFHWNVTGPEFYQYHLLFEKIYEDLFEAVDRLAEELRSMDVFAPGSLKRYLELTNVPEAEGIPDAHTMVATLLKDNDVVVKSLYDTLKAAESAKEEGLANVLQERIDVHRKFQWMLRATLKSV